MIKNPQNSKKYVGIIKNNLETFAFWHKRIKRKVQIRNKYFFVYAWHSIKWHIPDIPPLSWMIDRCRPSDTFFDVGANRGYMSLAIAACHPGIQIVAFEPNSLVYNKLQANIKLNKNINKNIQTSPLALGEHSEEKMLYIAKSDSASSFIKNHAESSGNGLSQEHQVKIISLDNLIFNQNFSIPNHIKIDTEGYEAPVLRGAYQTINEYKPFIYVEIHFTDDLNDNEGEITSILRSCKYDIFKTNNQILALPN